MANDELQTLLEGQLQERQEYLHKVQTELQNVNGQIIFIQGQLEGIKKCATQCCKEEVPVTE